MTLICFTPTTSLMSCASGKRACYAAFPILLLCTLTLWSDFYGNHSGIPPESPGAVAGSFPSPMDVQGSFPVLTLPHGNQSGPNSTVISLNLDGMWDRLVESIPSLPIFRVLPLEKDNPKSRSKIISLFEGLLAKISPLASLIDLSVEE